MKSKRKQDRLSSRIADWAEFNVGRNPESSKKEQRKANGGYHKPGSNNK